MSKQNPEDLLQKIKELESELKKVKSCKRYGLVWEDKPEIFEEKAKNALPILQEDKNLRIEEDENKPNNIVIEGDNYHSLSALSYTHKGKIDVIYIDPPYNTGNKDFIYNDSFVDKEDSYRHSKWLSFMNKRLRLAKDLLSDEGVILFSIDENEFAQLKLLCDDIFGEQNLVVTSVVNRPSEIATANSIQKHEYLLCYAKDITMFNVNGIEKYTISRGTVGNANQSMPIITFPKGLRCYGIEDGTYNKTRQIIGSSENIENLDPIVVENGKLFKEVRMKAKWRSSNDMRNFFNNDCQPTKAKINGIIEEIYFENNKFNPQIKKKTYEKLSSLILDNSRGSKYLEELGMKDSFKFPKSVGFIQNILDIIGTKNTIILDFFAGSGTTGHAVMELNKEDGGNRQFILCSSKENTKEDPEKNICKNITYERNKRVIEGYTNSKGDKIEGLGGNIRYYTTEFIKADKSIDDLRYSFIDMCDDLLCIKENTFTEIKLKSAVPELRLFKKGEKYTAILYDIHHFKDLVKLLEVLDGEISVYIFSLSKDIFEEELEQLNKKITVQNIPDDILQTYKKIFNF